MVFVSVETLKTSSQLKPIDRMWAFFVAG